MVSLYFVAWGEMCPGTSIAALQQRVPGPSLSVWGETLEAATSGIFLRKDTPVHHPTGQDHVKRGLEGGITEI